MKNILFVFAHQDDEVAVAPRIVHEVSLGNAVHCAYLTNGEAKGVSSQRRCEESTRVLAQLGHDSIDVAFIGNTLGIADGQLAEHLEASINALTSWIATWPAAPARLYFLAWEGGHHDHDAVYRVGLAIAERYGVTDVWQFPLYNGYKTVGRIFRTMRPLPNWNEPNTLKLSSSQGLRFAMLCWKYPSQRRTWLGLFPGVFRSYVLERRHRVYPIDRAAIAAAPHHGRLLYERMFGADRSRLITASRSPDR